MDVLYLLNTEKIVLMKRKYDKMTIGFARKNPSQPKATSVVSELIDLAKKACILVSHVLFDTWFCSPSSIIAIKKRGFDIV